MIEYASIFYYYCDKQNKLNTLQNKFIRLAYNCRLSTPISILQMIANIEPLECRVNKLILRHWYRSKYSSNFHPLRQNYLLFKKKYMISKPKLKQMIHSPMYIAYNIIKENPTSFTINNQIQPILGHISALPKYNLIVLPTNFTILTNPTPQSQITPKHNKFFVDGSCYPNPGKGSYGWFSPSYNNRKNLSQINQFYHPVTINQCEAMAILSILKYIE